MKWLNDVIYFFGGTVFLVRDIYSEIKTRPFYFNILLKQVYEIRMAFPAHCLCFGGGIGHGFNYSVWHDPGKIWSKNV